MSYPQVSAELFGYWVVGTVQEWLPGYADDDIGRQYRVRLIDGGLYEVEPARGPGVTRRFRIDVVVREVPT